MKVLSVLVHITGVDEKGALQTTTIEMKEEPGELLDADWAHIRPVHKMADGEVVRLIPAAVQLFRLHATLTKPLVAPTPPPPEVITVEKTPTIEEALAQPSPAPEEAHAEESAGPPVGTPPG
jgi:hypothetical protein